LVLNREKSKAEAPEVFDPEADQSSQPGGEDKAAQPPPKFGPAAVVALWNEVGCRPAVLKLTDARRRKLRAHLKDRADPHWWREFFEKVKGLQERGRKWLSFDWILSESNMLKVIEGNYDEDFEGGKKPAIARNHQQRADADPYYAISQSGLGG
jgi:hypothetical protein